MPSTAVYPWLSVPAALILVHTMWRAQPRSKSRRAIGMATWEWCRSRIYMPPVAMLTSTGSNSHGRAIGSVPPATASTGVCSPAFWTL